MKLFKGFLLAIAGLFLVITLISLLMPSRVMIAKSMVIHAPADKIFEQIRDLRNWHHWHPYFKQVNSTIHYSHPADSIHSFAEWEDAGNKNRIEITADSARILKFLLIREGEKNVENQISLTPVLDSSAIQADWQVMNTLKWYPWEKFSGIFIDQMTGPGYEAALKGLKDYCEK